MASYSVRDLQEVEESAPALPRCVEAVPDRIAFLAFGAPYAGPGDDEIVPGCWSDG